LAVKPPSELGGLTANSGVIPHQVYFASRSVKDISKVFIFLSLIKISLILLNLFFNSISILCCG